MAGREGGKKGGIIKVLHFWIIAAFSPLETTGRLHLPWYFHLQICLGPFQAWSCQAGQRQTRKTRLAAMCPGGGAQPPGGTGSVHSEGQGLGIPRRRAVDLTLGSPPPWGRGQLNRRH